MESIAANKLNSASSTANVKGLVKKVANLSFDADAVYESKDWPYLWPKSEVQTVEKTFPTMEELAKRKARTRRIVKICGFGVLSLVMYMGVFLNQAMITEYFTKGGYFALAVVGTAIAFALVHGTFAGHVLENLNFRAANQSKDLH